MSIKVSSGQNSVWNYRLQHYWIMRNLWFPWCPELLPIIPCRIRIRGCSERVYGVWLLIFRLFVFSVVLQCHVVGIWPSAQAPSCPLDILSPTWTVWAVCGKSLFPRDPEYRYIPFQSTMHRSSVSSMTQQIRLFLQSVVWHFLVF